MVKISGLKTWGPPRALGEEDKMDNLNWGF